jgi:predicted ABC-type transport system involved in lysophospholipase L1 biosynthesis ATPase subunit
VSRLTVARRLKDLGFETRTDTGRRLLSAAERETRVAFERDFGHPPRLALARKPTEAGDHSVPEYPRTYRDRIDETIRRVAKAMAITTRQQTLL